MTLGISINNIKYSILRVNVFDEKRDNPITISLLTKLKNNRWLMVQNKSKSPIEFFLMNMNLKYLDSIFENKNSNNTQWNEIIKSSWNNSILNIMKIYSELGNSMLDNDGSLKNIYERNNTSVIEGNKSQEYSSNFKFDEKIVKTDYLISLSDQNYCYYFNNQLSEFKEEGLNRLIAHLRTINISSEGKKPKIIPIHKFEYSKKETKLVFVKYSIKAKGSEEKYITNVFETVVDGTFKKYDKMEDSDNLIKYIIAISKQEIITEFSNGENNNDYPEINKLKPLVKDASGVLNIEKLAQIIKDNKTSLSKYLQE